MNEMIERVAHAIEDLMDAHSDWSPYEVARAAVAAMREPTEKMLDAGAWGGPDREDSKGRWYCMIDEALK